MCGSFILFLVFWLFWVLWFIFDCQGFIIKQGEEREKDISFAYPFWLHGSREVVTSKSTLYCAFKNIKVRKRERCSFCLTFLFAWMERSGEELATNG
jgi:hypothetical protein